MVVAHIKTDKAGEGLVEKFNKELKKTTLLKEILFDNADNGVEVKVDDLGFKVFLEK